MCAPRCLVRLSVSGSMFFSRAWTISASNHKLSSTTCFFRKIELLSPEVGSVSYLLNKNRVRKHLLQAFYMLSFTIEANDLKR